MRKMNKSLKRKEKTLTIFSSLSGTLSFLGGWQICHNLCLALIALLSIIGITVIGMPLLFLTDYAVYFWSLAVLLLIPTLILYWKNRGCMSMKLILLNVGIVVASVPFAGAYQVVFWLAGGIFIAGAAWMFLEPRFARE